MFADSFVADFDGNRPSGVHRRQRSRHSSGGIGARSTTGGRAQQSRSGRDGFTHVGQSLPFIGVGLVALIARRLPFSHARRSHAPDHAPRAVGAASLTAIAVHRRDDRRICVVGTGTRQLLNTPGVGLGMGLAPGLTNNY